MHSVIGALPLHRLPLSPPVIAGIALLEDRSAVIADLGVCLGRPSLKKPQDGTFLVINAGDRIAGFCVEGEVERFACPPERVLSLPPAVATPVADTCAVRGASLIPIINIRHLHDRLKRGLLDLPSPEPGPLVRAGGLMGVRGVRVLSVGGARFCVDAEDAEYAALGEGGIAPVPVRSRRLAGVALHEGAVVPVMLPGAFSDRGRSAGRTGLLLAGPKGARYGVAVDQDLGIVEGQGLTVLALPVLAAKPWLSAAVLTKGKICLLVDSNVFAAPEGAAADRPEQAVFNPASRFPTQFRRTDTAIVEFSLLGTRHAVPQEEMKDDLALLPFVPVPGTPEIVLGIAELRGALLPVLDLAAIFGRRSPIGKKSRMMHLVNGDFQALVITDEVAGSRLLPVESQRQVPIALPHQVLYGCYLDVGMVRLILNVEALAVHYEKTAVRELVAGLSPDIEVQTEQTQEAPEQAARVPPAAETVQQAGKAPPPDQDQDAVRVECDTETARSDAGDAATAAAFEEERRREEARLKAGAEAAGREQARQRVEVERLRAEDAARSRAAEQARLKAEADAKAREVRRAEDEAEKARSDGEARAEADARVQEQEATSRKAAEEARKHEEEGSRRKAAEQARETAAVAARRAAEEAGPQRAAEEAKRQAAGEARVRAEEDARERDRESSRQQAAEDGRTREEAAERQTAEQATITEAPAPVAPGPDKRTDQDQPPVERKRGKHVTIAAVMAAALVLIIYSMSAPVKQPEPPVQDNREAPATVQRKVPVPETLPPLYLTVPPERIVPEQNIYTVVKGDTLWGIAKRFTGNPLNYPRVARDNRIATPDLIFPGQRIKLVREKS